MHGLSIARLATCRAKYENYCLLRQCVRFYEVEITKDARLFVRRVNVAMVSCSTPARRATKTHKYLVKCLPTYYNIICIAVTT